MLQGSQIGRIQAFIYMCDAVFMTLNGRRMTKFGVWRWNDAKGGMRCAFPPYGLEALKAVLAREEHPQPEGHLASEAMPCAECRH